MKFSILAQATLAISATATAIPSNTDTTEVVKRENCQLTLQWVSNWYESALRRYRVQLITSPRNDEHINLFCKQLKLFADGPTNVQCFWTDGMFVIDESEAQGPAGHDQYLRNFNNAADIFGKGTGCNVVRNL